MAWKLDSDRPIYSQLLDMLQLKIISGEYPLGAKIKSVRDLAAEAGVNPNTMQKAFAELERRLLIRTERTSGRFVTEDEKMVKDIRNEIASEQLMSFMEKMESLGFKKEEVLDLIKSKYEGDEKND